MKKLIPIFVLVGVAVVYGDQEAPKPKSGLSSVLKVGQQVSLTDNGNTVTISFHDGDVPQTHKVKEIGEDYVVVFDVAQVSETYVPIYSIKAIENVSIAVTRP